MSTTKMPIVREQMDVLLQGVVDLPAINELEARLAESYRTQRPLVVKTGFDPTAPDLHLGHTVLMEKMAQFQRFGHVVVFLVGDYTARIGDPTGRNVMRPPLSDEQIRENAATYTEQCFRILDRQQTRIEWNSRWLSTLTFNDLIVLASKYNLGRMLERRDFRQRFDENRQIGMHELLYPLIQGYDSVALEADVELGGGDQIFNLNVGRHLMAAYGLVPQMVLTVGLLVGLDGVDKMSKSKGNHVGVTDPPDDMFGKIMSISDATMDTWIPLLTGKPAHQSDQTPLQRKKELARSMVARFCGADPARDTAAWWDAGRPPRNLETRRVAAGPLYQLVQEAGAATSRSDARRKIQQGGVSLDGDRKLDPQLHIASGQYTLRVGPKWAAKLQVI